jgi:small redox-active disulfide protein 2
MIRIEVLGPSCINCLRLEREVERAVQLAGVDAEIRTISNEAAILAYGVFSPPGLAINGQVVTEGRVPSAEEIASWLAEAAGRLVPA